MTGSDGAGRAARRPAAGPPCHDEACLTCSDAAVQGRVVRLIGDDLALVDTGSGGQEEVSVAFVPAREGDTIVVHAGEAIGLVSP